MVTLDTGFLEGTTAAFQKPVLGTVSGTGPVSADFCGMNSRAVTMTGRQAVLVHLTMLWAQTFQWNGMVKWWDHVFTFQTQHEKKHLKSQKGWKSLSDNDSVASNSRKTSLPSLVNKQFLIAGFEWDNYKKYDQIKFATLTWEAEIDPKLATQDMDPLNALCRTIIENNLQWLQIHQSWEQRNAKKLWDRISRGSILIYKWSGWARVLLLHVWCGPAASASSGNWLEM